MNVIVVERDKDHEPGDVLGVFSSQALADDYIARQPIGYYWGYSSYEFEVDEHVRHE